MDNHLAQREPENETHSFDERNEDDEDSVTSWMVRQDFRDSWLFDLVLLNDSRYVGNFPWIHGNPMHAFPMWDIDPWVLACMDCL